MLMSCCLVLLQSHLCYLYYAGPPFLFSFVHVSLPSSSTVHIDSLPIGLHLLMFEHALKVGKAAVDAAVLSLLVSLPVLVTVRFNSVHDAIVAHRRSVGSLSRQLDTLCLWLCQHFSLCPSFGNGSSCDIFCSSLMSSSVFFLSLRSFLLICVLWPVTVLVCLLVPVCTRRGVCVCVFVLRCRHLHPSTASSMTSHCPSVFTSPCLAMPYR